MSIEWLYELFARYGVIFIFVIIMFEYMNFPGLAAGIIMPGVGVLARRFDINLFLVLGLSVLAGVVASLILYYVSYFVGRPILDFIYKKFPKSQKSIDKSFDVFEKYGHKGFCIARLMPVIRTIIPIPAGIFKVDITQFIAYSAVGIAVWNGVLISIGYIFGVSF